MRVLIGLVTVLTLSACSSEDPATDVGVDQSILPRRQP